jgi:acyl carrier protein
MARGYLDDSLTAERFQQNPLSQAPNDRVYRSGDRGRYRPDGAVAYVGRRDAQVKIRGFRVEPAEVETVLMSHDGVREAAVVPYGSDRDDRVLVGYVVGTAEAGELRSFISARLPAAMVPAHFVMLDRLPRTASGKINRLALPEPEQRDEGPTDAAPLSPFEETLAGFWRELLNVERVGPNASFFDLGGHSLLAARLIARVRDAFQVEMPIGSLFEHPTITEFAQAITRVLIKDLSDESIQELINEDASLVGDGGSE